MTPAPPVCLIPVYAVTLHCYHLKLPLKTKLTSCLKYKIHNLLRYVAAKTKLRADSILQPIDGALTCGAENYL